jgi:hypothetical protein
LIFSYRNLTPNLRPQNLSILNMNYLEKVLCGSSWFWYIIKSYKLHPNVVVVVQTWTYLYNWLKTIIWSCVSQIYEAIWVGASYGGPLFVSHYRFYRVSCINMSLKCHKILIMPIFHWIKILNFNKKTSTLKKYNMYSPNIEYWTFEVEKYGLVFCLWLNTNTFLFMNFV